MLLVNVNYSNTLYKSDMLQNMLTLNISVNGH